MKKSYLMIGILSIFCVFTQINAQNEIKMDSTMVEEELKDTGTKEENKKVTIDVSKKNRKSLGNFMDLNLSFGVDQLLDQNKSASTLRPEVDMAKSWYFDFGLMFKSKLSSLGSSSKRTGLFLKYGLNFLWSEYEMANKVELTLIDQKPVFIQSAPINSASVSKTSLHTTFLQIPVLLDLDTRHGKGFKFSIGGYGGIRLASKQKLFYDTQIGESVEQIRKSKYNLNDIQYGLTGTIGYHWLHVKWQYQMSSLFKDDATYDLRPVNIGLLITI